MGERIQLTPQQQLERKKEKVYRRNFITFCIEAFLFAGSENIFSIDNVLPTYVSFLSDNPFSIALISVLFYGLNYGCYIFSCQIGVKAKSPKWISVGICFLQRIAYFFIMLSTYSAAKNTSGALTIFYVSLAFFSISAGLSSPLFQQMVSVSIFKNISSFYGTYSLFGSAGGLVGSLLYSKFLKDYTFPLNYRYTFLVGVIMAVAGSVVVAVGIQEVLDERKCEEIKFKDIFRIAKEILKTNKAFASFTVVRVISAAAEFAIPYYILTITSKAGVPDGYAGTLAIISLIVRMIAAFVLGKIGDRYNAFGIILTCSVCGAIASALAIFSTSWQLSTLMYIILSFATSGSFIATSSATIEYSKGKMLPIYSATVSLLCAPIYLTVSFGGAYLAELLTINALFTMTFVVYGVCAVLSLIFGKKYLKESS